jgi:Fur family ferric uptake transcriptional regulator
MKAKDGHKKQKGTHESHSSRTLEWALSDLKRSRLKLTPPRKAILLALVESHGPFTAEEIHQIVTKKVCDMATVYRCLASLEEASILRRVEFGDGTSRYELAEPGDHHHHHVICTRCKRVEIVDDPDLEEIDRFAKKRGFSDISHSLEFFGTCPQCK